MTGRIPGWNGGTPPAAAPPLPVPADLRDRLATRAAEWGVDPGRLVLAAHLAVLGRLTGEPDAATRVAGGVARAVLTGLTWHRLVAELRVDPVGPAGVEASCAAGSARLGSGVVLAIGHGTALTVRSAPGTSTVDRDTRVAGYHLAALTDLLDRPDGPVTDADLLDPAERRLQLTGLRGADRRLPDARFHELVERQAARTPDAVALSDGGRDVTYAELNAHANRIAHTLLAGLPPDAGDEPVVAVVAERDAEWAAAVLAVFKAGAVYLPVDPAYPADRIATLLRRSRCVVAVHTGAAPALAEALAGNDAPPVRALSTRAAAVPAAPTGNPGVAVPADRAAYVYFTSGTTGVPKGAVCEHLGFLNHLYCKIEDLGIGPADVVVQNAPQCFDISLWQLVVAWLVGGRTLIVSRDDVLDVERFARVVTAAGATVLQLVPSYLDILLGVERPELFASLRMLSVTGEAIGKRLVRRWFDRFPGVAVVNAYGATEASDDTTHEIMTAVPAGESVPVGRPNLNVTVSVVDDRMRLVPLGSPGELVFSGLAVGRGYLHDPERTAEVFGDDPLRPGLRLYRTGDYGRWLPDGHLEFLGRRDDQVKIRGMRVEVGEVESALLAVPGVRAGCVTVRPAPGGRALVAFYVAGPELTPAALTAALTRVLPVHMVPAACHPVDALPTGENGKVDKRALLAREAAATPATGAAPGTPTERRIATAWAEVLGRPLAEVTLADHFFGTGGDSLAAVRLILALAGRCTLADLTGHPVLADLARQVDARTASSPARTGLLVSFGAPPEPVADLVCVPDAGGNAVGFEPLARAVLAHGLAVHAVEPPAHDVAGAPAALLGVDELAARIAGELAGRPDRPLLVWGHGAGAAVAIAVARRRPVAHLFVGGRTLDDPETLRRTADLVAGFDDRMVSDALTADGDFTRLDHATERLGVVAAAYRHDVAADALYFARPAPVLDTRLTVVVALDDPRATGMAHDGWTRVAGTVSTVLLPDGGHHFPRSRPDATARALVAAWQRLPERETSDV